MKKLLTSLVLIVSLLYGEYVYIAPDTSILKDSYVRGYYSDRDYFGFSLGLFDKFEIFTEDRIENSLYGAKILLQRERDGLPSLTYTVLDSNRSKNFITIGKTFSYLNCYVGYEKRDEDFYGGVHFAYSPKVLLSYQYSQKNHHNFWIDINLYKGLSAKLGRFDKRSIVSFAYKADFSKNFVQERDTNTSQSDELENIFNSKDIAIEDINTTFIVHGMVKKSIWIDAKEFNAFKKQNVSKNYMRDAVRLERELKPSNSVGYELYISPTYELKVSKTKPSKDDFSGYIGANLGGGGLPLFLSYESKLSRDKQDEQKATINFVKSKGTNFFRVEGGKFKKLDGYDVELMKTFFEERFAVGANLQKEGSKKAKFVYLNYIPEISKTISINLKVGKFFYDKRAIDLSVKKFYKDAILGSNLFVQNHSSDYRLRVYLVLPINYKMISFTPTLELKTADYDRFYIDSKSSFENTIFDKNNITLQKELL